MKLSLNWLKEYIDHGLTPDELSMRMTMAGLEVEHVEKVAADTVFEIEITPNRPDCLSTLGLAREVSAITDKDVKTPEMGEYEDAGSVDISIEAKADCARYIGTRVDGVSVKSFPSDKSLFLQALGLKPISNIVDLSNFVMFEQGQPLHAFDYDKLEGGKIIVRRAKKGEKIITLDDVERTLDENILVIADAQRPVAIAGIMGGRDTGVGPSTKRVLLEAAQFDLGLIRRTSRKLGLTSDSCYRFERGVPWRMTETASNRITDLVLQIAGGCVIARRDVIVNEPKRQRTEIIVTSADILKLLGCSLDMGRCEKILKRLGCVVVPGQNSVSVISPYFRNDIQIKEDVIEEVGRVIGYDNLPMSLPHVSAVNIVVDHDKEKFNERVSDLLIASGFNEVVLYSLMGSAALEKTGYKGDVIKLQNPMSAEQELMRPSSLAHMLTVAASNMNHGQRDIKIFEVGKKYLPSGERWTLSIMMSGRRNDDWRHSKKETVEFFDLKGVIEEVCAKVRVCGLEFSAVSSHFLEEGQSAGVFIQSQEAGYAGKVSDAILVNFDIKKMQVYFAEIELDPLKNAVAPKERFKELNEFPTSVRDISLLVKNGSASFEQMRSLCKNNSNGLLQKIDFIELYSGDKIDKGFRGYVLSFIYQAQDRTLTDGEVNTLHESLTQKLVETFAVVRR